MRDPRLRRWSTPIVALAFAATLSAAPPPAPAPAAAPAAAAPPAPAAAPQTPAAPPPSPVSGIRNKLAAGDLPSAESILEVHREQHGEDGPWLAGLGWLARGALLVGDTAAARQYASDTRAAVTRRLAGRPLTQDRDAEGALGAAIEVEAQLMARKGGRRDAVELLRRELAVPETPPAFRSRLYKRLAQLTLEGSAAPELVVEDQMGSAAVPTLASLKGRPVVLFLWAEWCADCKAQATSLARVVARHRDAGLATIALSRWYETGDSARAIERVRADSVWSAVYIGLQDVPRAVSTRSMVEYGGSATPTFVFIDRQGVVRRYTPTRLSEAALEREVAAVARPR
jgi:thiol-disulfide isomerase/thioredoxin